MGVLQNAYLNSASSLFVMKLQGTIVDVLVSAALYAEILGAFVLAAVVRGLLVGGITFLVAGAFTGFEVAHPLLALAVVTLAAVAFAAGGVASAIWAETFEQVNFFPTFFILPLTFLGGVFFSVRMLPPTLAAVARANPIFYLVDLLRHAMLGAADGSPWRGRAGGGAGGRGPHRGLPAAPLRLAASRLSVVEGATTATSCPNPGIRSGVRLV